MENDNLKPEDAAAAARKLIETDKVVAMVGGFSILDCPVNADYYKQQGYYVIVAGVPAECFSSPNIAAANMGPGYSALGAAQIVIDKGAKGKMVTIDRQDADVGLQQLAGRPLRQVEGSRVGRHPARAADRRSEHRHPRRRQQGRRGRRHRARTSRLRKV